jgi:anaphase-promoting complex subunit 1
MSIGFIFLGYGNYTFNKEDMSIAALLISIYPMFPNAPGDNRWHLQALRHFYVLAMEEKIFHSVDVDANKVVNVAARMTFLADGEYQSEDMNTPVLLQESKKLTHIKIIDEDYYDVNFSFEKIQGDPKVIYIKRKHFKDINPKLLNPENVLTTEITQQSIKNNLV